MKVPPPILPRPPSPPTTPNQRELEIEEEWEQEWEKTEKWRSEEEKNGVNGGRPDERMWKIDTDDVNDNRRHYNWLNDESVNDNDDDFLCWQLL